MGRHLGRQPVADLSSRNAGHDRYSGDVGSHDGSGADHGPGSDREAIENDGLEPLPLRTESAEVVVRQSL